MFDESQVVLPSSAAKVLETRPVSDVDVRVITLEITVVLPDQHRVITTTSGSFSSSGKTKPDFKTATRGNAKGDNRWKGVSKSVNNEYAFHTSCGTTTGIELIDVKIGGVKVYNVMIDSGSGCNHNR